MVVHRCVFSPYSSVEVGSRVLHHPDPSARVRVERCAGSPWPVECTRHRAWVLQDGVDLEDGASRATPRGTPQTHLGESTKLVRVPVAMALRTDLAAGD